MAQWFLLIVLLVAAAVGALWWQVDHQRAFWVVLSLLVATCPCALSLATPTALTAATGSLHKLGLLITRGHVLEGLNHIDTVIFDKTGTLTEGRLTLKQVLPLRDLDADRCLALAAALENRSEHPIARAFGRAPEAADSVASHPGLGLEGLVEGRRLRIGQAAFVSNLGGSATPAMPGDSDSGCCSATSRDRWPGSVSTTACAATPPPCSPPARRAAGAPSCYPVTPRRWSPASLPNWASTKPAAA